MCHSTVDYSMWNNCQPVKVTFGTGVLESLGNEIDALGVSRGLLVTSPSFVKRGVDGRVRALAGGRIAAVYSGVSPNPEASQCDECVELIRRHDCDFVVAVGGGSVLDCAKAASVLCFGDKPSAAYVATGDPLPAKHLPVIAVPATAGTGSEVTSVAVLSDHSRGVKAPLAAPALYPAAALVDPELTFTAPAPLVAASGLDALSHAVEAYWGRGHNPVCDALAVQAASMVLKYLPAAFAGDNGARVKMSEAALTAGLAFNIPKTSSAHACSYPLTNILGIPHGEACALTLTWFMRFNAAHGDARTSMLAARLGYESAEALADAVDGLKRSMGMACGLASYGLSDEDISRLAKASCHPNLRNNPVDVSIDDLMELYRSLAAVN